MHYATITITGVETSFQVNIIASPVENVIVPTVTLIEGADGSDWGVYDENGDRIGGFFRYSVVPEQITIECTDGNIYSGSIWQLQNELGITIGYSDSQGAENEWGVGRHSACITVDRRTFEYDVVIAESPIQSVSVDRITLIEGIDGYYDGDSFVYSLPDNFEFAVTLKDGTVLTSQENHFGTSYIEIGNKSYAIDLSGLYNADQSDWKAGNTYQVTAKLCGKPCVIYVRIVKNEYSSLTIRDEGDLYLVFTKKDGTEDLQRVISFDARSGNADWCTGILTTDKAQYQHVTFTVDKPDDIFEKGPGYHLQCTNNLCLKIGDLTSNILEKSNWLALQLSYESISFSILIYSWYAKQTDHPFNDFYGTITTENIDAIVTIAVNICDYFGCGDIGDDGFSYGVFDVASVKKDVELLFGIKDIDISAFSGYDPSTGKVRVLALEGGCGPTKRTLTFEENKWNIDYAAYSDEEMTTICDSVHVILNKDAKIEKILFSDEKPCSHTKGDLNGDGNLSVTDVVLLRKAILQNGTAGTYPAGDLNEDGVLSVTDVVLLRKKILNQA